MPHVIAVDRPLLWAVGDPVVASGVMETGGLVVTGLVLYSDPDENALMSALATAGVTAPPLPDVGIELTAGEIYDYSGTLVMVRHDTVRVAGNPLDQVSEYGIYQPGTDVWEWVAGEVLVEGQRRSWEGVVYELYRDIGANNWFPPPQVPAHWQVVVEPGATEWVSGEPLIYDPENPIRRTYEGNIYELRQNPGINIWPPPTVPALWLLIGPA